ncbi:MAG: hypothetical protein KME31_25420 [Tolypothrix carrinoi HA7290-LM1]|nr:hypothetical protein [Tolypothrix carrinoi HA7290-LM1]
MMHYSRTHLKECEMSLTYIIRMPQTASVFLAEDIFLKRSLILNQIRRI